MVQFFEWFTGSSSFTGRQIRHLNDMTGPQAWAWYATDEEMRESHENSGAAHGKVACECGVGRTTV
jgi:hypothetical protein